MRCPLCGAKDTRVIDTRLSSEGYQVKRRRECPACQERFTTYESAELSLPVIIKRNGVRESFNENKLRRGMRCALEKRPVEAEEVEAAVWRLKKAIKASGEREFRALDLGELVMKELSRLDHVAFIRFASVYRSFEDVSEFTEMVEHLKNK